MTADRLDLDTLEALIDSANGAEETRVEVEIADLETLIAAARENDAKMHKVADALVNEQIAAVNAIAERDAAQAALDATVTTARNRLDEIHRLRAELETVQAALARVTHEAMVERIERSIQNAYVTSAALGNVPWLDHRQAAVNALSAILATATEGQEAGGK